MNIGFMGLGKLGLPIALAIESKGHRVTAHDPAEASRRALRERKTAYREKGVDALLRASRIEMLPLDEMVRRSDMIFVTIQTPHEPRFEGVTRLPEETSDFDYSHLCAGAAQLGAAVEKSGAEKIVIVVSTVLPGTIRARVRPLLGPRARLCYHPLFISMGEAIRDFLNPEFVLFGVDDPLPAAAAEEFYRTIHAAPFRRTTIEEAEIIKVLYNTFISTKIAFANTAMELCHRADGADVDVVLGVLGQARDRIVSEKYLRAGMGDGGACHPRDNIALSHLSRKLDMSYDWFRGVMEQRERQSDWLADLIEEHRAGRDVVILGRSFKPESSITTGSPAVLLENILRERGLAARSWDPHLGGEEPPPSGRPFCYFIATRHPEFERWPFEPGSVVLDPWRYVSAPQGVELIPIGRGRAAPDAARIDIGLCVPVLNERAALGSLLDDISASLKGGRYTVCVVDDGSTDGTIPFVEERARLDPRITLLKRSKTGSGCRRGAASRAGLEWLLANTSHAFFSDVDADGANRPDELARALAVAGAEGADVVIASRYVPGAVVTGRPFVRRAGSLAYNTLLRAIMGWGIRDYSTSFRLYRRGAAELLRRYEPLYDSPVYLVEMIAVWLSHGLRIVEMSTTYRERNTGASKVVPGDFLRGAAGALRVGLAYRAGKFRLPRR